MLKLLIGKMLHNCARAQKHSLDDHSIFVVQKELKSILGNAAFEAQKLVEQSQANIHSANYLSPYEILDCISLCSKRYFIDFDFNQEESKKNTIQVYKIVCAFVNLFEQIHMKCGKRLRTTMEEEGFVFEKSAENAIATMQNGLQSTKDKIIQYTNRLIVQLSQSADVTRAAVLNHISKECILPVMPTYQCSVKKFRSILQRYSIHPQYSKALAKYTIDFCAPKATKIKLFEDDDDDQSVCVDLANTDSHSSDSSYLSQEEKLPLATSECFQKFLLRVQLRLAEKEEDY